MSDTVYEKKELIDEQFDMLDSVNSIKQKWQGKSLFKCSFGLQEPVYKGRAKDRACMN
ncbi:hypothetical protein P8923_03765 [Bacillus atrophaeus]|uniref:hypothetical protein n=1 Tax=Bacillus atrophaeus TaxID=1452 RepID=UPI0002EFC4C1|nr:hypothetical protein [Bacillus atrophaeus]MEC0990087.1 hypothetical protein [Bacillus atrophaeus]